MVTSTTLCLAAARFGLAPSAKKVASAGLKLTDRNVDLLTNDPAGVGFGLLRRGRGNSQGHGMQRASGGPHAPIQSPAR